MMSGDFVKAANWPAVLLAVALMAAFTGIGARMVWQAHKVNIVRARVQRQIEDRRRLSVERDELMRRVAEMKSTSRLEVRARMMDLALPDEDRVIFVGQEDGR